MFMCEGELREAVKNGNYMAVKRALGSKEDYNLDQEVCTSCTGDKGGGCFNL